MRVVLYGANGYTGALIARAAVARGMRPVLAGRSAEAIGALAAELGCAHAVVDLADARGLDALLADADVVLHCAGPFHRTMPPMVASCLRTRTHYLDITGELGVFEALAARDAEARAAGIVLLPGTGFDVVPSDCLAAHTAARLPGATSLVLAFQTTGRPSAGTRRTMTEQAGEGGAIRAGGRIVRVPPAFDIRPIDFGDGPVDAVTIPWGDVSTAYHSTGIPDVRVYAAYPPSVLRQVKASRWLAPLLRTSFVQRRLLAGIAKGPAGPSDAERARGISRFTCEVRHPDGRVAVSRLRGPEGYTMTVATALLVLESFAAGAVPAVGFTTPSRAFGADFVLRVAGVARGDEPVRRV